MEVGLVGPPFRVYREVSSERAPSSNVTQVGGVSSREGPTGLGYSTTSYPGQVRGLPVFGSSGRRDCRRGGSPDITKTSNISTTTTATEPRGPPRRVPGSQRPKETGPSLTCHRSGKPTT